MISYALLDLAIAGGNENAQDIRDTIAKELNALQIKEAELLVNEPEKLWKLIEKSIKNH